MKNSTAIYAAVIALFLSLATSLTSFSQESHGAILLNMVNSRLGYGDLNSTLRGFKKDVRGVQAGISWQSGITKRFSIVSEAYFMTKGGTVTAGNPVDGMRSTIKFHTLEVPVLARVHVGRFYFNAGPYLNYILAGKQSSDNEGSQSISFGSDHYRKFETGFHSGVGYQFNIKKARMAFDVRYVTGITSVSRDKDIYNRTINISLLVLRSWKRQR